MDYSCGFVPQIGGSLRRTTQIRRSVHTNKIIGGIDWHLRTLFLEQVKCFENKMESDCNLMGEMLEFYKKRAQVEQDYSEALNKLANQMKQKNFNDSAKKSNPINYSSMKILTSAIEATAKTSQAHNIFAEILSKQMILRCQDYEADIILKHKKIREIILKFQNRVLETTGKLSTDQKEFLQREHATIEAEKTRRRFEEKMNAAKKKAEVKGKSCDSNSKFKRALAEFETKDQIHQNELSCLAKAKNSYFLQLVATSNSISKYFNNEVKELLECAEFGFHNNLSRLSLAQGNLDANMSNVYHNLYELFSQTAKEFDHFHDQAVFFKKNEHQFTQPSPYLLTNIMEEKESIESTDPTVWSSLEATANNIQKNIENQMIVIDELAPKLESIESQILAYYNEIDYVLDERFKEICPPRNTSVSPALSSVSILNESTPLKSTNKSLGSIGNLSMISNNSPCSNASTPFQRNQKNSSTDALNNTSSATTPDLNRVFSIKGSRANQAQKYAPTIDYTSKNNQIRSEKEMSYFEEFAKYKSERHRLDVMNAKLAFIKECLQKQPATRPSGIPLGKIRGAISVFPDSQMITPQMLAAKMPKGHSEVIVSNRTASQDSSSSSDKKQIKTERKVLRVPNMGKPKLFGGSIEEYFKATGEYIPPAIYVCINTINNFGMHHQGVFRVPGSQSEINEMRTALEKGESILMNGTAEARDINSTAGLLKMYFRELGEKPFSPAAVRELVTNQKIKFRPNSLENLDSFIIISGILKRQLSTPVHIVMRYLFGFLNHLTEYADDNMMDPYNLAICFGPTLMPIPSDLDPVQYQTSVNDIVKNMIIYHEDIFDQKLPGPKYEKFLSTTSASQNAHHIYQQTMRSNSNESNDSNDKVAGIMLQSGVVGDSYSTPIRQFETTTNNNGNLSHVTTNGSYSKKTPIDETTDDDDEDDEDDDQFSENNSQEKLDLDYVVDLFVAIADYDGSSELAIPFKAGDQIYIYRPMNNDWYEGSLVSQGPNGRKGLIPRLYVAPKEIVVNGELRSFPNSQILREDPVKLPTSQLAENKHLNSIKENDVPLLSNLRNVRPRKPQAPQPRGLLNTSESELDISKQQPGVSSSIIQGTPEISVRNTRSMICSDFTSPEILFSQQTTLQQSPATETDCDSEKTSTLGDKKSSLRMDLETFMVSASNNNNNNNSSSQAHNLPQHHFSHHPSSFSYNDKKNNSPLSSVDHGNDSPFKSFKKEPAQPSPTIITLHQSSTRDEDVSTSLNNNNNNSNSHDNFDEEKDSESRNKLSFADRLKTFEKFQPPQPSLMAPKPRNGKLS